MRLSALRKSKNMSMSALARKAEMHVSSISAIENNHLWPYPGQMKKIADALGWKGDPAELFEEAKDDDVTTI